MGEQISMLLISCVERLKQYQAAQQAMLSFLVICFLIFMYALLRWLYAMLIIKEEDDFKKGVRK